MVHLLRAVPTPFARHAIVVFDREVQKALSHGVGILFPERAWLQLRLPLSLGGAGMRRASDHAAGAYLASVMRAAEEDSWAAHLAMGFAESLDELCVHSGLHAAAVRDPAQPTRSDTSQRRSISTPSLLCSPPPRCLTRRACSLSAAKEPARGSA